ncbi:MAG TPA: response regulator transcription factor [Bacteroidota bacterium]
MKTHKKKINVALIEDENSVRASVKSYLKKQPEFECGIVAESVETFIEQLKNEPTPDIVLMDIKLPGLSGISGISYLKEKIPAMEFIVFSSYSDWELVFDSLRAGASGYLLKGSDLSEIKKAIELVNSGGAPMSPEIAKKVIKYFSSEKAPKVGETLTIKERQIVDGLVEGLSYKMIAGKLDISIDTVRFHIKHVYRKLHVNSKAEVIGKSVRGEI